MELLVTDDGIARVEGDEAAVLDLPFPDISALLRATGSLDAARHAPVRARVPKAGLGPLRAPLSRPTLWGVGLNYRSKAATAGRDLPTQPILYLKPATALAAPGAVIPIPDPRPLELDYEAELALVFGSALHEADPADVWPAIVAITPANDLSARDVMRATSNPTLAKGYPTFSPLGPSVRCAEGFDDGMDVRVRSWVNGELRQDGRTNDFIFQVSDLVARLSRFTRLEPGDVLLTGTPPGTGQDRGEFLSDGDEVVVEVDGLLPLVNRLGALAGTAAPPAA